MRTRSNMRALAHFSVTVEEPPCLALPFNHIRQHIRSDSILLEGDDCVEYKARLFIRSKSSENIYVAEGWSRFERAHGINEGDILFCMLLEGPKPKLKISVAKTGRQNDQYYTDSGSDSESRVLKKRGKDIRKASMKVRSRKNVLKDVDSESESDSQSSIWEGMKKHGPWRRVQRHSRKQLHSLTKKAHTVAEPESSKRKAEPESSKRKEVLQRIHAFESRLCNPSQILELTTKKLNKRAAVPKEFALRVRADNGDYLKLMVSGHEQWKVKWINTSKFKGFGTGWLAFLDKHNLAVGDYIMLEITAPKTIAVTFFLDHHSSIQGTDEEAYSKSEHEQITCKIESCTSSMSNSF